MKSDHVVFFVGMLLAVLAVGLFAWKMTERLTQESSLRPVPVSTPTPPAPPIRHR